MSFQSVEPGSDGGPGLLAKIALSGSIRTRQDAENFRDALIKGNYEKGELFRLYRAVLAVLGDNAALQLPEPDRRVAMGYYAQMKKWYIGDSECRCIRTPSGSVAVNLTTCPVHGQTPGAKPGLRNLDGLMR